MTPRVRSDLLVASLLTQVQGEGGFGAVLRRGDGERGDIVLVFAERGETKTALARQLDARGVYSWTRLIGSNSAGSESVAQLIARRERFDPDLWVVELDIAAWERFIDDRLND